MQNATRYQFLNKEKYDHTYKNNTQIRGVGIFLVIINVLFLIFFKGSADVFFLWTIPLRIIISIWATKKSGEMNRDRLGWFMNGFIMPSITLILLGSMKKLNYNFKIDTSAGVDVQYDELKNVALYLVKKRKRTEAVSVFRYIIDKLPHTQEDIDSYSYLLSKKS